MTKIALVSLGCAKNLVDSEVMAGALKRSGHAFVGRLEDADVIIVNTCGFIRPAREEAERTLRKVLRLKKLDPRKRIVAAGCYVERDKAALAKRFPAVDAWTGVRSFDRIADLVAGRRVLEGDRTFLYSDASPRVVSTPGAWAYVKVSEGCSHRCGFCSIPLIKGPYVSRSEASIAREVRTLAGLGVREINLISHDTTFYGRDKGRRDGLPRLIERLGRVEGVAWIRALYGYPEEITDRLLEVMAGPKVCRYLDIPFQHADPGIVKAMRRGLDGARALALLDKIRAKLPGVAVRTSLIVGFPGEGQREFEALMRFAKAARFDHMGVFTYSAEPGTASYALRETVSEAEKIRRRSELMALQAEISRDKNRSYIGTAQEVIVEERLEKPAPELVGRCRFQAPEVDGRIRVAWPEGAGRQVVPSIIRARITSASTYDLRGRVEP